MMFAVIGSYCYLQEQSFATLTGSYAKDLSKLITDLNGKEVLAKTKEGLEQLQNSVLSFYGHM